MSTEGPLPVVVRTVDARDDTAFGPCRALREEVFVAEQRVPPEVEFDGLDPDCVQLAAWEGEGGALLGTARLRRVRKGQDTVAKAERVAVLRTARGRGVGRALMDAIEEEAVRQGLTRVTLSAQESAVPFYEALGYVATGERFVEADIPHETMNKPIGGGTS